MQQSKMFKVICPMKKKDGGKWWMRLGSAFLNHDNSINVHLDAIPLGMTECTLQIRELDAEDLKRIETARSNREASHPSMSAPIPTSYGAKSADGVPF